MLVGVGGSASDPPVAGDGKGVCCFLGSLRGSAAPTEGLRGLLLAIGSGMASLVSALCLRLR